MDSESNGPRIVAICIASVAAAIVFISLRMYTRLAILGFVGTEDWFMIAAGVLSIATSIAQSLRTKYGLGRHIWTVPYSDAVPGLKTFYAAIALYNTAQIFVKLSILFQYIRIFDTPSMKKACRIALIVILVYGALIISTSFIPCIPVDAFWDSNIKGKCVGNLPYWYTTSVLNIVTDVGIFVLPMPVLWKLKLPIKQKVGLIGILTIGLLVCIISIARLRTLTIAGHTQDPTWDDEAAATWSIIELNLGIICGCLPMLKPLLARLFPSFVQTVNSQRGATGTFSSKAIASRAVGEREGIPKGSFQVIDEGDREKKKYATSTEELWIPLDEIEKGNGKMVA